MVLELKFDSISELAELQRLAVQADKPVYIANEDDSTGGCPLVFGAFRAGLLQASEGDHRLPLRHADAGDPAAQPCDPHGPRLRGIQTKKSGRARPFRSFLLFTGVHEFPIIRNVVSQVVLL